MTREVLGRKLARLRTLLTDLEPHRGKSPAEVIEEHYEIERLLELLVQVAVDLVNHDLAERGSVAASYRDAFLEAARRQILPDELAARLADAASLRNVLVHMYDEIDYDIVAASIDRALEDFTELVRLYSQRLVEEST